MEVGWQSLGMRNSCPEKRDIRSEKARLKANALFTFVIPRFMIGTSGKVRTARELGIDNAPRWITKRGWMPVN
jgi:hypothetical protein